MSKYGVFSGPYFLVFSPNTGKYGPEKTPHLDTFHAVFACVSTKDHSLNELHPAKKLDVTATNDEIYLYILSYFPYHESF